MKKTLSVFLSFVMLFTCLCVGGISAQAAEKKTKLHIYMSRKRRRCIFAVRALCRHII